MLQGKSSLADVAGEGALARVGPHVPPEILRGPESSHAERAHHLQERVRQVWASQMITPALTFLLA